ncbi:sensor histidine kinase [Denitratisoma oestradiolicum]|uniref:histidine kinase n=1 Tax=Denitratisoma oestradiolicum TaxID=311182 RepID=A0A6S6XSJ4_9PROT|nr:sensor histidine kinase [Denitratisoma oestradiolicum]TWO80603.1 hypothetical protein CBW56_09205 [Denitratisoma oestradiolicum]CAB1367680.1 Two-component sensor histidine kinase [Denitratisoma oestradiolicum]
MGESAELTGGSPTQDNRHPPAPLSRKGVWTIAVLVAYFILVTAVIAYERGIMIQLVNRLQQVHETDERLVALNMAVSRTVLSVNENYFNPSTAEAFKVLTLEVEAILPGVRRLAPSYPILRDDIEALTQSLNDFSNEGTRAAIADLRTTMHHLVINLDTITTDAHTQKQETLERYQTTFNRVTLEWSAFGIVFIAILSGVILFFFRALTRDIERIHHRAVEIVRGYRGDPLEHTRADELGALMDALNQMQQELRQHESRMEIVRQQQFHKEKMAAIGSLAAAVAHEINNPLSAIVGIAETMDAECKAQECDNYGSVCHPEMILDQTRRVMQITRQISEFSVPQSQDPELLDINGLVRSTCNFVKFDRRVRLIDLRLALGDNLPAIFVTADHLVQSILNLLINAADAMQGKAGDSPRIEVMTSLQNGRVLIEISDNGCGIAPSDLPLVFNEHFTTKGPGRGSGLGLALSRSLIRDAGGDISIDSTPGVGTTVTVTLPIPSLGGSAAGT